MAKATLAGQIIGASIVLDDDGELHRIFALESYVPPRTPPQVVSYLKKLAVKIDELRYFQKDLNEANEYERIPTTDVNSEFQPYGDEINRLSYSLPGRFNTLVREPTSANAASLWNEVHKAIHGLRLALLFTRRDDSIDQLEPHIEDWCLNLELDAMLFPTTEAGELLLTAA